MANRQLQGWSADPFRLHEERYFSGGRPTKLVRDGKVESYEDPPSETYDEPDDDPGPAAAPSRYPAGSYAHSSSATQIVRAQAARKRSRTLLILAATGIVAATVAGLVLLVHQESHSTPNPNRPTAISPDAFVRQSAAKTLAERTADLTLSGSVQTAGHTATIGGTGAINFSTNDMELSLSIGSPGQLLTERELAVDGNLYLTYSISGLTPAKLTGGRDWIEMPTSQYGSVNLVGSDPLSSLSLAEQQGIDIRSIGTKVIEGQSCTGYVITPTKAALLASVRAEFTKLGYSQAMINQEVSLEQAMLPPAITVWLDAQGLMREMSMELGVQTSGSGTAVSVTLDIYVSYYGTPVQVTAPAPSDVISFQSFLKATGAKG